MDAFGGGREGNNAGRAVVISTFRERLGIKRAIGDDALVMQAPPPKMPPVLVRHVKIVGQRSRPQARAGMHIPGEGGRAAVAADLSGGR
jgi:hypothetical protein